MFNFRSLLSDFTVESYVPRAKIPILPIPSPPIFILLYMDYIEALTLIELLKPPEPVEIISSGSLAVFLSLV